MANEDGPLKEKGPATNAATKDIEDKTATERSNKLEKSSAESTDETSSESNKIEPQSQKQNSKANGDKIGPDAGGFPAIAVYHRNHINLKGKGLPKAAAIIAEAMKNKSVPERVNDVKSAIKAQLNAEFEKMYNSDPTASEAVKANVRKGLAALKSQNLALYGLDRIQPKRTAHDINKVATKDGGDILFEGGQADGGNLIKIEGIGKKYGARTAGLGDFVEYDHILDKSFVHQAKSHKIIDPQEKQAIKLASDNNATTKLQSRLDRLEELASTPLFSDKPKILGYADDDGIAVPLYRPLATEVTSAVNHPADTVTAPVDTKGFARDAANYVKSGAQKGRQDYVAKKRAAIQRVLEARTTKHAESVREAYLPEVAKVKAINAAAASADRKMKVVLKNLYVSLRKAESETVKLFN